MGEADISSGGSVSRAGLILTGGGARAAYQVGVLKALARDTSASRLAVSHHRRHLGWRRVGQHPGRERDALASVRVGNRKSLGEFPRPPGVPLRRARHAQGRRAAGWGRCSRAASWGRRSRCSTIRRCASCCRKVTDFDAVRANVAQRRPARAGAVRHQLFHRALGVVLRGRDHRERMVARAAARRARAAVARLPHGEPGHSVPVSADLPARRILRRRRDAPDRAAVARRFTSAPTGCW